MPRRPRRTAFPCLRSRRILAPWVRSISARGSRASRIRRCSPGAAGSSTTSRCRARSTPASCAAPTATPRSARSTPAPRWRMPGVHAVLTAADLPEPMRSSRIPMMLPVADNRTMRTQHCLALDEVNYAGQAVAVVIADNRHIAEDAAAMVAVDYDVLPAASDAREAVAPGAPQVHTDIPSNVALVVPTSYGDVEAAFAARRARVRGRNLGASRRRHGDGGARGAGELRAGDRHADGVVVDADAASRPPHAGRSARPRSRIDPHDRARRRRRLRTEGAVLCRGGGDPGGGDEARPAGEMVRGPPRAFPVRDPGARPVLEGRGRGRCGRQAARRSAAACCTTPARSRRGAS